MYPRLLDGTGAVIRRIEPVGGSLELQLDPLSSAELQLQPGDSIPERSWVAMYTEHGLAGIFRSKPQTDRYGQRTTSVSLVHGACELNDWLTGKADETQKAANTAISTIFSSYHGTMWTLGTVAPTAPVIYSLNQSGVLDSIVGIMEQLPGYMLSFDQSVTPWVLSVVKRPSQVSAEGRLPRNIQSVEISRDDSDLCTRVYYGENNAYIEDTAAKTKYGIIEHRISESGYTDTQLLAIAQAYLESHKAPKLSVNISAIDLSEITGEPLDQITLGSKYRLVMPDAETEENRVIEQIICTIRYDDLFNNPNPQITLASDPDTIITFLKQQRRSGGASRQVAKEEAQKQYQHWVTENEVYKESVYKIMGVTYDEHGNVVYQKDPVTGEIIYDDAGNPIPVYDENSNGSITGRVVQTAQNYNSLYQMTLNAPEFDPTATYAVGNMVMYNGTVYKFTAAHTGEWTGADVAVVPPLQSQITQNATEISQKVSQGALSGYLTITAAKSKLANVIEWSDGTVKAAEVITAINALTGETEVKISADMINLNGYVTASEIFATDATIGQYLKADNLIVSTKIKTAAFEATNGATIDSGLTVSDGSTLTGGVTVDSITIGYPATSGYNITKTVAGGIIKDASVSQDGLTLTLTKIDGTTINFNKAGSSTTTLTGGWVSGKFTVEAQPQGATYWTEITQGATTWNGAQATIPIMATDSTSGSSSSYATGRSVFLDCSSITGSITSISGTALTPDQTSPQGVVTLKASGTNLNDYTENATLSSTTYTDGSDSHPCVNLILDSTVIGRIDTQATYDSGWGGAVGELVPPTTYSGSGEQLTFSVGIPSSTVGGSASYSFSIDKDTASATGYANVKYGNNLVGRISVGNYYTAGQNSVVATFGAYTGTPGTSSELSAGTYKFEITKDGTATTTEYYTVPSTVVPKVSKGTWSSGQITFTAGTTGGTASSVKIVSGNYTGTLDSQLSPTKITFDVLEDLGSGTTADTTADVVASISRTAATLSLGSYDSTNHKFAVSKSSGGSVTVGSQVIQVGVTTLEIPVTIGSNVIGDPHYEGDGVYSLSATGTIAINGQNLTVSGTDTFTATDAINTGKQQAAETLSIAQTSATNYNRSALTPTQIESARYYFVKIGDTAYKKFQAPASGGSDRWARYTENIVLGTSDIGESTWLKFATYDTGVTETDQNKKTSISVDASAVYNAGITAGMGGAINVNKGTWVAGECTFTPSAGTGSEQKVQINFSPVKNGLTSNARGTINVLDYSTDINRPVKVNLWNNGSYVYLLYDGDSYIASNALARVAVNGTPGGDARTVSSLSSVKLTADDIATVSKVTNATFSVGDPQNDIPIQIDASDVYTKGFTDGSRMSIERPHIEQNALTQNHHTYTIYPSTGFNVMTAAQFTVDVPTYEGIQTASIGQTTNSETTYSSWSYDGKASLSAQYCRIKIDAVDGSSYYFKINASDVYQQGVSAGSGYNVMGTKSLGTIRESGYHAVTPDAGYNAMEKVVFTIDIPRIQESVSQTIYAPGTTTITPTGQYGAMKKAIVTVPSISVNTESDQPTGTSPVTTIKVGHNKKVTVKFGSTTMATLYFKAVT